MLRTVESFKGYAIRATDDELGNIEELFFDDEKWGIRYLVVKTGAWLTRQRVLISPYSVLSVNDADKTVQVNLTRKQVESSPDIDTHQPVSRQMEQEYTTYFGYEAYWAGPYLWGAGVYPGTPMADAEIVSPSTEPIQSRAQTSKHDEDAHLRSTDIMEGYAIAGTDENIGHVQDILLDDEGWAVRYLIIDTRNWWPGGKKVLIAIQWIDEISWVESVVRVRLTRDEIRKSPEYDEGTPLDREFEHRLHDYYGRTGYWEL